MVRNNYQGALQQPTGSRFNAKSTANDVIKGIDLTGKTAIVTGGNAGIGLETAKVLAGAGAAVIVPARDIEKARKNLEGRSRMRKLRPWIWLSPILLMHLLKGFFPRDGHCIF